MNVLGVDNRSAQVRACDELYDKAEWAMASGLPLEMAIHAVLNGYSSADFDKRYVKGEFE